MTNNVNKTNKLLALILRTVVLLVVSVYYLVTVLIRGGEFVYHPAISVCLILVWLQFLVQTILKLLGSPISPIGARKHLKTNYAPTGASKTPKNDWKKTFIVAFMWGFAVVVFGLGKHFKILDEGILVIAFLLLSVLDGLSVHFFCPFRVFVMKNKCCTTCRIYNWDGLMIVSPLYFVHNVFSFVLIGTTFILFLWWEIAYKLHPERFFEETNENLKCKNCKNLICPHKNK